MFGEDTTQIFENELILTAHGDIVKQVSRRQKVTQPFERHLYARRGGLLSIVCDLLTLRQPVCKDKLLFEEILEKAETQNVITKSVDPFCGTTC
jgi:hypothetical protein